MIDIESKIVSYREDTDDYRLCLTREEIDEINNCRANAIDECIKSINNLNIEYAYPHTICNILEMLKEQT